MSLPSGARIGVYEVVSQVGEGGMGEVYRARDTKLDRHVALKILPASFATDPDRLMRFEREARTLASLNHPNIAAIYGVESPSTGAGHAALIMELVEGDDLSAHIARGAIPVADALPIARQIAEALEAAHDAGVIHRDLKPANIKVRPDGTVKVLDFGLAKAIAPEAPTATDATMTSPAMTQMGIILGTAAYMAPEQAKGRPVDKRADVWAFGVVVFEMLTGRALFHGDSVAETLGFVATRDPDFATLPPATPPAIRRLLERCLTRDPKLRLRDIGEARIALANPEAPSPAVAPARRSKMVPLLAAALVVALVALGAIAFSGGDRDTADPVPLRLSILFPEQAPQKGQPLPSLALSPDGRTLVYTSGSAAGSQLWKRDLSTQIAEPIPGTEQRAGSGGTNGPAARQVFFSPDGKSIGFVHGNVIRTMPITLGPAKDVCEVFEGVRGATWTQAGDIVFAANIGQQGLWRVPATGGTPVRIAEGEFYHPDALPGGQAVVVAIGNATAERSAGELTIAAVTLATGAVTKVLDGGTYVRYVPTGHLVFARENMLVAASFDPVALTAGEARTPMVTDLWMDPAVSSSNYAISAAGTLVYAPGAASDFERALVAIDGDTMQPLSPDKRYFAWARMSPAGRFVAVVQRAWRDRILIFDTNRQTFSLLTSSATDSEYMPVWSRDGAQVAFAIFAGPKAGLHVAPLEGGAPTQLYLSSELPTPTSFSPDGSLLFSERRAGTGFDILAVSLAPGHAVRPVLQTPVDERDAVVSPDGHSIAYRSWRTGEAEVWVSDFPSMTGAVQVSLNGGQAPVWSLDSRRVFFRGGGPGRRVRAADVSRRSTGDIPPAIAVATFPTPYPLAFVDVMPDGRFLGIDGPSVGGTPELRVIVNWFQELRTKVPK